MCKKLVYKTGRILSYHNLAKECKMVSVIDNTYVIPKNFQQNEDYGNSDKIKANPFNEFFFYMLELREMSMAGISLSQVFVLLSSWAFFDNPKR